MNFNVKMGTVFVAFLVFVGFIGTVNAATDAYMVYKTDNGFGNDNPSIRAWSSSGNGNWGSEIQLNSSGSEIMYSKLLQSPTTGKFVLVTLGQDNMLDVYICPAGLNCSVTSSWKVLTSNIATVTSIANTRRFDMAFESSTGNLVLVYAIPASGSTSLSESRDIAYRTMPSASTSFGSPNYIDDNSPSSTASHTDYSWVEVDPNPLSSSNEIVLAGFDHTNNDANAWVWNGTNWSASTTLFHTSTLPSGEAVAVRYAADGSKAMVVGANGSSGRVAYMYWNGATWTLASWFSARNSQVNWVTLKADPATDDLQVVLLDASNRIHTSYWSGSSWSVTGNISTNVGPSGTRPVDFDWNPTGSTGLLIYEDNSNPSVHHIICSPNCISSAVSDSGYTQTGQWITLVRNTNSTPTTKILASRLNNQFDLGSFRWDNSVLNNYGNTVITDDASSTSTESYSIAFVRSSAVVLLPADTTAPVVNLNSPADSSAFNSSNVIFSSTATDDKSATLNCSLFVDNELKQTNSSVQNNSVTSFTATGIADGSHKWNVTCTDSAGNVGLSSIRNFKTDTRAPTVVLNSPAEGTTFSGPVTLGYTTTDSMSSNMSCSLYLNGAFTLTSLEVVNNTASAFPPLSNLSEGNYNWNVKCTDNVGNTNTSATRHFSFSHAQVSVVKLDQTASIPSQGGVVEFKITVTNTGNATLNPVNVVDTMPVGLTFLGASLIQSSNAGQTVTWNNVGPLAPENTQVIYITATVDNDAVNSSSEVVTFTNNVVVTATPTNGNNVTASSSATVNAYYAEISVVKLDQTASIPSQGGQVMFNITVTNSGNVTLDPVVAADTLPNGLTYLSASVTPDLVVGQTITWNNLGPMAAGQSTVIQVIATTDNGVVDSSNRIVTLANSVGVIGVPDNGNNVTATSSVNFDVYYAHVSVVKLDQTASIPSQGGQVMFNITVTNSGNVTLDPIKAVDTLPVGLTYSSASVAPDSIIGQIVTWNNLGSLAEGQSATIYLNATVDDMAVSSITPVVTLGNTVDITGIPPNGNSAVTSDTALVTVYQSAMSVVKTAGNDSLVGRGDMISFMINVSNTGAVDITVSLNDTLDATLDFAGADVTPTSISGQTISWNNIIVAPGTSLVISYLAIANVIGNYTNGVEVVGVPSNGQSIATITNTSFLVFENIPTDPISGGDDSSSPKRTTESSSPPSSPPASEPQAEPSSVPPIEATPPAVPQPAPPPPASEPEPQAEVSLAPATTPHAAIITPPSEEPQAGNNLTPVMMAPFLLVMVVSDFIRKRRLHRRHGL